MGTGFAHFVRETDSKLSIGLKWMPRFCALDHSMIRLQGWNHENPILDCAHRLYAWFCFRCRGPYAQAGAIWVLQGLQGWKSVWGCLYSAVEELLSAAWVCLR
jgi:hypothetical protein